ncbi:DUF58 domain-containing protein [Paenibacillus silvae]|uniref:DUF58 domain-containing protein n=1 Tax=Paenibacillus silvae TaxID=1325358 RepID=UPI002005D3FB|nr:DUF58 domain-containing protein [Paenibacillus silvae]MCK6078124.1 DUF58 domain-containing protein [Paenibacillus silvae]MCK6152466.1 DUF58 domain-containing protein [Paenibacillus silvae]MCK6271007.1 DUF58 domain-containing protein [Paenibacillus silvae]
MSGIRGSAAQVLIAILLIGVYLWHGGKSALFLAAISVLVVIYGIVLQLFGPRQVHIQRHRRPGHIVAGESLRVQVHLEFRCALPLLWLVVCDNTPAGVHRKLLFPGMKRQWSYQYEITGLARGVHVWEEGRIYWGDVFGWSKACALLEGEEPLVVVPDGGYSEVSIWPESWGNHGEGRVVHSQLLGPPGLEIREYQQGDAFNRIHWKSTARTGRLHTLIPEISQRTSLAIIVYEESSGYEDNESEGQAHEAFEQAVRGAASWLKEADDAQMPCQLWLSGDELSSRANRTVERGELSRKQGSTNHSSAAGDVRRGYGGADEGMADALRRLAYARLCKEQPEASSMLDVSRLEQLSYGSSIVIFTGQLDERLVGWLEHAATLGFQVSVHLTGSQAVQHPVVTYGASEHAEGRLVFSLRTDRLEGKRPTEQGETIERLRTEAGINAGYTSSAASGSSARAQQLQVWTDRLAAKGVRVICQEAIATNSTLLGGKAGIVDVGA